jgi:acetyl-CoA synthetase
VYCPAFRCLKGGTNTLEAYQGLAWDDVVRTFRWAVPSRFNMGVACSDAQPPDALAIVHERRDGAVDRYTFGDLSTLSNRLSNALAAHGVARGDRVAVILPQSPWTAVAHLAVYKLGAIAVPLSSLFGPDALEVRLRDSGARLAIVDVAAAGRVEECAERLPALERLLVTAPLSASLPCTWIEEAVASASSRFSPVDTAADDPGLLIYTSGTTGSPKGALHAHRVLLGHLPGFELSHEFFPKGDDVFWTPADWAWIGGLMDALCPTLLHGRTIVVADGPQGFDPEWAVAVMARHRIRNAFLPPTALKMLRRGDVTVPADLRLRTIMSGGESLGDEVLDWVRGRLGVTVNEIFGQTECNYVVGNSSGLFPVVPGSMGRGYPGHEVAVVDAQGMPLPPGEEGEIAVRSPDPVMFLEYWGRPEATRDKFRGEWLLTGDFGVKDGAGYIRYVGRRDDLINSAGYRIGPTEIESCLMRHAAVAMAAVIGVPDPVRGEVVKACIVLCDGHQPSEHLAADIQAFVRARLAAYQYPRIVDFVPALPLTTTGKVRRLELREAHLAGARA